MKASFILGPTPCNEDCVQVGSEDYIRRSIHECRNWARQLWRTFPDVPDGVSFRVRSFSHDFGRYYEVEIVYDDEREDHVDFVCMVDSDIPLYWDTVSVSNGMVSNNMTGGAK